MKQYISEGRAIYEDVNHGLFSQRLAEWAISNMETEDHTTGTMKKVKTKSLEEVKEILAANKIELQDEFLYNGWYLFNMALADYPKTIKTDADRASFVEETINDPDGNPENVLACFEAKMEVAGVPIFWEKYL